MDEAKGGFDREIQVGTIAWALLLLSAVVVASMLLMGLLLSRSQERASREDPPPPAMREAAEPSLPPPPRLQESPPVDLATMRTQERYLLENYGWVDRSAGVSRIPIADAMEI